MNININMDMSMSITNASLNTRGVIDFVAPMSVGLIEDY